MRAGAVDLGESASTGAAVAGVMTGERSPSDTSITERITGPGDDDSVDKL
jgi:hypothetical protein